MSLSIFRYSGGKTRQAKKIAEILEANRKPNQMYVEPFIGAGSVFLRMSGLRLGFDIHKPLIAYYHAIQSGWLPPEIVGKDEYELVKKYPETASLPLQAFYGFPCSFAGKYFGGYAQGEGRQFSAEGHRATKKALPFLQTALIGWADYRSLHFKDALIFCDPPYDNTTGYDGVDSFDSKEFWKIMQKWANDNTVFVTEFSAPKHAVEIVHEFTRKSTMDVSATEAKIDTEYLYRVIPEGSWW